MPANSHTHSHKENDYIHVYNQGILQNPIFLDEHDYEMFLHFLRDYLTPTDHSKAKTSFVINGRKYIGKPHLPKNYHDQIDLVAYCLANNHFHLVLLERIPKASEKLLRSLSTRYAIYFNKKYSRTGPLFEGPYKSARLSDNNKLDYLLSYIHLHGGKSSSPIYTGQIKCEWVKIKLPPAVAQERYKHFLDKITPDNEDVRNLGGLTFDEAVLPVPTPDVQKTTKHTSRSFFHRARVPETTGLFAVFLLLLGLGIRNINLTKADTLQTHNSSAQVLSEYSLGVENVEYPREDISTTEIAQNSLQPQPTASEEPALESDSTEALTTPPPSLLTVRIRDGASSVNIRSQPSSGSEKIGEAKEGDLFKYISNMSGWYNIVLPNGTLGYISAKYIEVLDN